LEIAWAHDVIPIEHAARLVAGDRHGDALWHSSVHKVANRGSPKVMAVAAGRS